MYPLLSSRLNSEVWYAPASSITACDEAIETKDIRAMSVDNRRSLLLVAVRRWNSGAVWAWAKLLGLNSAIADGHMSW
jgi:hypothetical protein